MSGPVGVQRYLRRLRLRFVAIHAARAVLVALAAAAVLFLVSSALTGPTSTPLRSVVAFSVIALVSTIALLHFLRPVRDARGTKIATKLNPMLASAARSAVELHDSGADSGLVAAHARRVESALSATPLADVVPWRSLFDRATLAGFSVLSLGLAAFAVVDAASVGAFALLHPGAALEGRAIADVVAAGSVELTYPSYMRRPSETLDAPTRLQVPVGTTVRMRLAPRFALRELVVRAPLQTARAHEDGGIWSTRFVVRESGRIDIDVTDASGRELRDASERVLDAQSDAVPEVILAMDGANDIVERSQPIPISYTATDDIGLATVELVVETPAGAALRRELAHFDDGALRHADLSQFTAAEAGALPGDTLSIWVEASDHDDVSGPNLGRSMTWSLTVASEATRREALVGSLQQVVDYGLDALADRLESPVPDTELSPEDVARRFARVEASGRRYATALIAVARQDIEQIDTSVLRELHRRLGRVLAAESRAHGDPPRASRIVRADENTTELLETQVLFIADLLGQVRLDDAASIARELENLRREMTSLLAELRRTDSPEARQALMAAISRAQARMRELAARMAAMGEEAPQEFTNPSDGPPVEQAAGVLDQMRQALDRGDLDEAERQLLELERQIDQMARSLQGASDSHAQAQFGPRERAMAEAIDRLSGLETEQRQLADRSEGVRRTAADRALNAAGDRTMDAARALAEDAREAADAIRELPGTQLNPMDRELHEQARQRLLDTAAALEQGDLGEARRMTAEAQREAERLARDLELSAMMFPGRPGTGAESAQAAREAARNIDSLGRALDDAIPDVASYIERAEREQLATDAENQDRAHDAARTLGELFAEEPDGTPLSPDGAESVRRAGESMQEATRSLRRNDPLAAARAQREAARELSELREKLERQRQQEQNEGGGGGEGGESEPRERVVIPEGEVREDGVSARRAILDAMRRAAPEGYEDASRRYFEELLR